MKLNNIQIKNAKPRDKMYRLCDGDNLYLEINPNGSKYWRVAYRFNDKRRQVALGKYPLISLQEARGMRQDTQKLLMKGIDPVAAKKQERLDRAINHENNFESIAREWHQQRIHTWQPKHAANILKRLAVYVFPKIGHKPIREVLAPELLLTLRPIEKDGKHEMAHRVLQTSGQIFRYAVATGRADRDITQDLKGALKPTKSKNFAHLSELQLPAFIDKLNQYDTLFNGRSLTKWSFQLLIHTFVRSGELRGARWEEIDFDKAQWRIPAARMKMKEQHIVPLSKQSLVLLKKAHELTGNSYSG